MFSVRVIILNLTLIKVKTAFRSQFCLIGFKESVVCLVMLVQEAEYKPGALDTTYWNL